MHTQLLGGCSKVWVRGCCVGWFFSVSFLALTRGSCPPGFLLCIPLDRLQLARRMLILHCFYLFQIFRLPQNFAIEVRCGYIWHPKKETNASKTILVAKKHPGKDAYLPSTCLYGQRRPSMWNWGVQKWCKNGAKMAPAERCQSTKTPLFSNRGRGVCFTAFDDAAHFMISTASMRVVCVARYWVWKRQDLEGEREIEIEGIENKVEDCYKRWRSAGPCLVRFPYTISSNTKWVGEPD